MRKSSSSNLNIENISVAKNTKRKEVRLSEPSAAPQNRRKTAASSVVSNTKNNSVEKRTGKESSRAAKKTEKNAATEKTMKNAAQKNSVRSQNTVTSASVKKMTASSGKAPSAKDKADDSEVAVRKVGRPRSSEKRVNNISGKSGKLKKSSEKSDAVTAENQVKRRGKPLSESFGKTESVKNGAGKTAKTRNKTLISDSTKLMSAENGTGKTAKTRNKTLINDSAKTISPKNAVGKTAKIRNKTLISDSAKNMSAENAVGKTVKRRMPSGGKPGKKCTISDRFCYRDPDLPIDCEDAVKSSAENKTAVSGKRSAHKKTEVQSKKASEQRVASKRNKISVSEAFNVTENTDDLTRKRGRKKKTDSESTEIGFMAAGKNIGNDGEYVSVTPRNNDPTIPSKPGIVKSPNRAYRFSEILPDGYNPEDPVTPKRGRKKKVSANSLTDSVDSDAVDVNTEYSGFMGVSPQNKEQAGTQETRSAAKNAAPEFYAVSGKGKSEEQQSEKDPSEPPIPDKSVLTEKDGAVIKTIVIAGQIEGHSLLPQGQKATRYEELIPQLVEIEESEKITGLLMILNTVGGDVEAGLALSEMIAGMKKPTASLVLGGGHSIGIPLAVSTKRSFIVPSATMTLHPVRITGMVLSAPQTYVYMNSMQQRIIDFTCSHCSMTPERFNTLMLGREELSTDLGTVLDGKRAVKEGLIDTLGGLSDAISFLKSPTFCKKWVKNFSR